MWWCRGDGRQGCWSAGMERCRGLGVTAGLGASLPAELSAAALGGGVPPPPPRAEPPQGLSVSHAWEQEGCQSPAGAAGVWDGGSSAGGVTSSAGRGGGGTKRETEGRYLCPHRPLETAPRKPQLHQCVAQAPRCGRARTQVLGRGEEPSPPLVL